MNHLEGMTDPDAAASIVHLEVRYLGETADALHVADTGDLGVACWLPRSQVIVDAGELLAARAVRARNTAAALLKLSLPLWLALDRGLVAAGGEGQGELF